MENLNVAYQWEEEVCCGWVWLVEEEGVKTAGSELGGSPRELLIRLAAAAVAAAALLLPNPKEEVEEVEEEPLPPASGKE